MDGKQHDTIYELDSYSLQGKVCDLTITNTMSMQHEPGQTHLNSDVPNIGFVLGDININSPDENAFTESFMKNLDCIYLQRKDLIEEALKSLDKPILQALAGVLAEKFQDKFPSFKEGRIYRRTSVSLLITDIIILGLSLYYGTPHENMTVVFKNIPKQLTTSDGEDTYRKVPVFAPSSSQNPDAAEEGREQQCQSGVILAIPEKLSQICDSLTELHTKVANLQSINEKVDTVLTLCASLSNKIDTLEIENQHSKQTLQHFEATVKHLNDQSACFSAQICANKEDLISLHKSTISAKQELTQLEGKIEKVTKLCEELRVEMTTLSDCSDDQLFNPERTVVATGLIKASGETNDTLRRTCKDIISLVDRDLESALTGVRRTGDNNGRPGIVQIAFRTTTHKLKLLQGKMKLRNSNHSRVFLKSAQTHEGRLLEQNFKTLVESVPALQDQLLVNSTGKLVSRTGFIQGPNPNLQYNLYRPFRNVGISYSQPQPQPSLPNHPTTGIMSFPNFPVTRGNIPTTYNGSTHLPGLYTGLPYPLNDKMPQLTVPAYSNQNYR